MIISTVAMLVKEIACKLVNPARDKKNVNIKNDIVSGLEASWANGTSTDSRYSSVVDQASLGNRYQRNMPHHGRTQSRHLPCLGSCEQCIYFQGENTACLSYSPVVAGILDTWHSFTSIASLKAWQLVRFQLARWQSSIEIWLFNLCNNWTIQHFLNISEI